VRIEFYGFAASYCIFKSEESVHKQPVFALEDRLICTMPNGLSALRLDLFADDVKALTIVLIEPVEFDRTSRVVVKQNSIVFMLTRPITSTNAALLSQTTCVFDVGQTSG
jgi:hypothetical protein